MFNNRMLAVAAVLVMAVPALGAATPIVVPPVPEQLVEGHTVFTVIEIVRATRTTESRFAAAVAVLVREYEANQRAQRFPGVLWFNDQYLVNPLQQAAENAAFRYPCGGAVMAVNAGDPDPRVAILRANAEDPAIAAEIDDPAAPGTPLVVPVSDGGNIGVGTTYGPTQQTYPSSQNWVKPYPGTYAYGNDYAWVGADSEDSAIYVDGNDDVNGTSVTYDPARVWSDTTVGTILSGPDAAANFTGLTPWDYDESYLITDPNDHSWVIDKYKFYTRDQVVDPFVTVTPGPDAGTIDSDNVDNLGTKLSDPVPADSNGFTPSEHYPTAADPNGLLDTEYAYPVWVVNMLGSPVFIVDNGIAFRSGNEFLGENCVPFKDLLEDLSAPANGALCGAALQEAGLGTGADQDVTLNAYNGVPPWTDDPCMGYMEPSRNGYCYGGQDAEDVDLDGDVDKDDCLADRDRHPLRLYNALLYFKLEDLKVFDTPRDHSNPLSTTDTNGCSEEQYTWGPNPPQAAYDWPCPGADDDREGNSHPFHPSVPVHEEEQPCLPAFGGPNPTNHGGSTYITPADRAGDDGWFDKWTPCDYAHATRNIDIYFSPGGRPFPPVVRNFDVIDLEGSSAPFQDFHSAYPGVTP